MINTAELIGTLCTDPNPLFNQILRVQASHERFREIIEERKTEANLRQSSLMWLTHSLNDTDNGAVLEEHALFWVGEASGLVLTHRPSTPDCYHPIEVKRVSSATDLGDWVKIVGAAYGLNKHALANWEKLHWAMGLDTTSPWQHYLGYREDIPLCAGSVFRGENSTALSYLATPSAHRKQGLASSLAYQLLERETSHSSLPITLFSSNEAYNLLRQMGFDEKLTQQAYAWGLAQD